jgi:hypothetical protein
MQRRSVSSLLDLAARETATTLKVPQAYPVDQGELKRHPVIKSARELAWMFTLEQELSVAAINGTLELSGGMPAPPASFGDVVASFERSRERLLELLRTCDEAQLTGTVKFPVGPKQVGDIPKLPFVHFLLLDQIHHRGQFSIYLRLADAKVPSIYGPTADEPWM